MFTARVTTTSHETEIRRLLQQRVEEVLEEAARETVDEAKRGAPVRTDALRDSIEAESDGRGVWLVRVGALYGAIVEFGTMYVQAIPFLRPAIEAIKPSLRKKLERIKLR